MSVPPPSGGNPWQPQQPPPPEGQAPYPPQAGQPLHAAGPTATRRPGGMPAWGWAILGCGGCGFVALPILAAILFPVFAQAREKARQASCASNLKQQGLAILMYAQDHNDRLPPAAEWMDVTDPYIGSSAAVRQCPSVAGGGSANSGVFGYAFDSRLSGKPQSKIAGAGRVGMAYDSDDFGRNANDPGTSLPTGRGRHGNSRRSGNNLLFADGSVRWTPLGGGAAPPSVP